MKEIRLNAFELCAPTHQCPGLWKHPRSRSTEYTKLSYWADLARTLERGLFDGVFIADITGPYDVYAGNADAALRSAAQVPNLDPMVIIPAMAMATENLGFGVTSTLLYEPAYPFARRMSSLDHLTNGRVGWNIVTGYLESAAKAAGLDKQIPHDVRYKMAEDYMELVYKFWEASWQDDAVVKDIEARTYADPARVHKIKHDGPFYKADGIHLSEPSPQRTPVLYQAGGSSAGVAFAGKHAECVFLNGPSKRVVTTRVKRIRDKLVELGRDSHSVRIFSLSTVIVGRTDEEAQAKLADYRRYVDRDGALALLSGWTGIDFSKFDMDEPVKHVRNDAVHAAIDNLTVLDPDRVWTVGEIADFAGIGGASPIIVGSPQTVADQLQSWIEDTDVDGFNLNPTVKPECVADFVDLVVPELQRRGVYKREYAKGTLREKLFNAGARTSAPHPSAAYRGGTGVEA